MICKPNSSDSLQQMFMVHSRTSTNTFLCSSQQLPILPISRKVFARSRRRRSKLQKVRSMQAVLKQLMRTNSTNFFLNMDQSMRTPSINSSKSLIVKSLQRSLEPIWEETKKRRLFKSVRMFSDLFKTQNQENSKVLTNITDCTLKS